MKRIILLLMSLLFMVTLSACNKPNDTDLDNTEACEKDLLATLEELRSNTITEKSYIYSPNLSAVDSSSDFSNEINKKIAGLVEYTVKDITINGESADARVTLITPDVYYLITEIASEMQENNVDQLLEQLNNKLDEDVSTKEYEVTVGLRLINDHWYLVPTGELSNAFSGGIIEQYSMMGLNIIEGLLEEENDG